LVALDDCSLIVDKKAVTMKSGQRKFMHGKKEFSIATNTSNPISLVEVDVATVTQALTFGRIKLSPGEETQDASDRNDTLLIAVTRLKLTDVCDLNDEDEAWQPGPARAIDLNSGQFTWLRPGMHAVRNTGTSMADFITIEW